MTDQVDVKQVKWEDLEVAEEQEVTEWEEGNEPLPTRYKRLSGDPVIRGENWEEDLRATNPYITKSEFSRMQRVHRRTSISLDEWGRAVGQASRDFAEVAEVYQYAGNGRFEQVDSVAICTPHRNPITRYPGDCPDVC